ncbi:hypothetical protein Plim_1937 [Planctopirus limnophila DSM 3776]|uniref:Uncharacterized protein n=1 Tax=Planctopirus limnophila (strain ATCC 43296 / DSM 3776 / IFAM 1008 / Mu 290) TaxID=521674 RepID=D5SXT0_PLAL2|nr:hypothetical protein Plim_1937 [Planctopirus limnophila DSM 3776]
MGGSGLSFFGRKFVPSVDRDAAFGSNYGSKSMGSPALSGRLLNFEEFMSRL